MKIFGYEFLAKANTEVAPSFVQKASDDGAISVAATGVMGVSIDLDGSMRSEVELINRYRDMALQPEVDAAVDEIINESISVEEEDIVNIILDNINIGDKVKKIVVDEFRNVLNVLNFQKKAYEILRRYYVDGRLYYHVIIDVKDIKSGIKELRYIDPRKIRKVKEYNKTTVAGGQDNQAVVPTLKNEYFIFNDKGFGKQPSGAGSYSNNNSGIKVAKDSIAYITSGVTDNSGTAVLSYLNKAFKPMNQLRTMEDALVIYRIVRAPERRIWYVDVGNLPNVKAEQYMKDLMAKHKNRLTYDAATGDVTDQRKFMCYALDTKIPLLDGRTLELQELIEEYEQGKLNWAYSCDPETGKFSPGPISWAGITKNDSEVVKVTFDNGKFVICTPDHKFPVWGKGFVEAKDLVGESIIPGYRRKKAIEGADSEYEQIFKNDTKTWEFTHREVAKWKDEVGIRDEMLHNEEYRNSSKKVTHHLNFNKFDNSPTNLVRMNHYDHIEYHGDITRLIFPKNLVNEVIFLSADKLNGKKIVEKINKNILLINEWKTANPSKKNLKFKFANMRQIIVSLGFKSYRELYQKNNPVIVNGETYACAAEAITKTGIVEYRRSLNPNLSYRGSYGWKEKISKVRKGKVQHCKSWKITQPKGEQLIVENLTNFCKEHDLNRSNIKYKTSKGYKAEKLVNHKAVSIEYLPNRMDVGCITIDMNETYHSNHTYLLDVEVFSKNTMLEDYWLPRREGGRGTEVDTLPGGQTLGEMDDVLYFQKKLYQSLNVPIGRLNSEAVFSLGRATETTRDEVKFAKFISRFRGRFSELFTELLGKQLILKGIINLEDWENISPDIKYDFSKDNYFSELKDNEILRNRLDTMQTAQPLIGKYYSQDWARKNILKQTDEQIEEMDHEISDEASDPRWMVVDGGFGGDIPGDNEVNSVEPKPIPTDDNDKIDINVDDDQKEKIRSAVTVVKLLRKKKNKSDSELYKYRSAIQTLSKNGVYLNHDNNNKITRGKVKTKRETDGNPT